MANVEKYELTGRKTCREVLAKYPDYRVFRMSGFAFKGKCYVEDDKKPRFQRCFDCDTRLIKEGTLTFEESMEAWYQWAAAFDICVNHDEKAIYFNAFSFNDMD